MTDFKLIYCFKRNLQFWLLLGIYPLNTSWPLLYAFYSKIFIFIFIILYNVLFTVNLFFLPKQLDNYIEELIFYFTVLSIMSEVLTFLFKRNKINKILLILESEIFEPDSKNVVEIIDSAKIFIRRYWNIYIGVCATSNIVHVLTPLLKHFVFKVELILPVSSYSFLPDNIRNFLIYPLYFYESIGMHFHMLSYVNIDTFFVGLMIFLVAQLNILENKLTNITKDFGMKTKVLKNDSDLIFKLNQVIIHHDKVIKFCCLIQDVFSPTLFVQFGVGSCIICMCLIRFTMPAVWQYYIFLSTYSAAMIIQILVPCWFGTRIMDKSSQLTQAIYNCDWIPTSKRFKSIMLVFVARAHRPLSITGWKMFLLSLTTFTSIMNTAYSFFTLLRHMQSR